MNPQEFEDIINKKTTILVAGQDVVLDPSRMRFNEATLSEYEQKEAIWLDYFGARLADAEAEYQILDLRYEVKYSEKYKVFKESGCTEKQSEASAKTDEEVIEAKEKVIAAKRRVKMLQQHLRAWDKNHDNSQSRGHTLRKEMDKLHPRAFQGDPNVDLYLDMDAKIDKVIKSNE